VQDLQRIIGDRGAFELEKEDKSVQLERDIHRERLAAEE